MHAHAVMHLEQSIWGLVGFSMTAWKAHKEMCAAGASTWARHDIWELLTCIPGTSGYTDPYDPLPCTGDNGRALLKHNPTRQGNPHHKQGRVCRLYNRTWVPIIIGS